MEQLFITKVRYSDLDDNKVTESYLVEALSYTEAEARTIDYLSSYSSDAIEIKSLKPLGVSEAVGMDANGNSYRYFIVGTSVSRKVLVKELSALDACKTVSDSWEEEVTSVRLVDIVEVIK